VLLILTDDQGYGDLSLHGHPDLETPAMDAFARESTRFDRFYVSPVCAPTRASLLTGRYHLRTGAIDVTRRREVINPDEVTLAELFRDNGYATGCFGKWHNGSFYPETPNGQGFDQFYGFPYGHITNYFDPVLDRNGMPEQAEGYITDILTDAASEFMLSAKEKDTPFFCYLSYNAPHTPALVQDEYYDYFRKRGYSERDAAIGGMVASIDDNLARLLDRLDKANLTRDTIVIFMSDNGPLRGRFNAGMKGFKAGYDEGSVRVPFFIRWPGHFEPNKIIETEAAHIDILPTLAELCHLDGAGDLDLDGVSLRPLLLEKSPSWPDRQIFTFPYGIPVWTEDRGAVHQNGWLAVKSADGWSLYFLPDDPNQAFELSEAHPDKLEQLVEGYESAFMEVRAPLKNAPTPIPVGYSQTPETILEAHDALLMPKGVKGIKYNYAAGFAHHWINGWTNTEAYPEWSYKTVTPGKYGLALHYCMSEELSGVKGHLMIAGQRVTFTVTEAFDPEVLHQPWRVESEAAKYASKPWKRLVVGDLILEAGVGSASVHIDELPGGEAFELKALELFRMAE
jgi:arylsulfatase A